MQQKLNNLMVKKFFGTQKNLAKKLGVKQQTVSDWVRGKINPSIENAKKIDQLSNGAIKKEQIRPDVFA
jgi:DNA-binding transcriptional regulator YdaS (Cro superfamily)